MEAPLPISTSFCYMTFVNSLGIIKQKAFHFCIRSWWSSFT